jgi:transcription elongation factor Elf1
LKKVEVLVNEKVRQRDSEDGYFKCINCGFVKPVDCMNAGHLIPVSKSSFLRFNMDNIHGECQGCNAYDQAKVNYTMNLIEKIGHERVQWLADNKRKGHKWSRFDLEKIIENLKTESMKI